MVDFVNRTDSEKVGKLLKKVAEANPEADTVEQPVNNGEVAKEVVNVHGVRQKEVSLPEETFGFKLDADPEIWEEQYRNMEENLENLIEAGLFDSEADFRARNSPNPDPATVTITNFYELAGGERQLRSVFVFKCGGCGAEFNSPDLGQQTFECRCGNNVVLKSSIVDVLVSGRALLSDFESLKAWLAENEVSNEQLDLILGNFSEVLEDARLQ